VPIPSIGIFTSAAKSLRAVFVAAVTLGLLTHFASAQQTLGSINGTVMDASGAVVQGAQVKARAGDDFITNPILPLAPGFTPQKATTGGTDNGKPYVNPDAFTIPFLNPGESGVPPCGLSVTTPPQTPETVCDTLETGYGPTGRNAFRAPFQTRFDFSIVKDFKVSERMARKFEADAFNIFNHPSFNAPNGNFTLNPCFSPNPCYLTPGTILASGNTNNFGVIQQTVGSNRFLQLAAHLTF
jgi:hypothetical protein